MEVKPTKTEVKPAVAVVTQKLTDILIDKSVANNKVMTHLLKGVQKSLIKLHSFSEEKDVSDAPQTQTDWDCLRNLYAVEDAVEKFNFRIAQRRKRFGFLMKQTFFFNNLNSCRRLTRKIKKIKTNISSSTDDGSIIRSSWNWSLNTSLRSISGRTTAETTEGDEEAYSESRALTPKSSSRVCPSSEIPRTPSPERNKLTFSYYHDEEETNFIGFKEERLQGPKHTSSFHYQEDEPGIFGLTDAIISLVARLTQPCESNVSRFSDNIKQMANQHISQNEMFVPIVGEVGSGKTTLARVVYRNRKIKDHFELHDWISVTEECSAEMILHSVLKKVTSIKDDEARSQDYQAKIISLQNHLEGKRYLIVLDGVGSHVLEDLIDVFPDENNGSRVIFTSCGVCKSQEMNMNPHIMQSLTEEESWNMFLKKAGKEKEADQIQVQSTLKDGILDICRGLPIKIVLVARLLSTKKIERWSSSIARDQCSDDVLTLCYDDLRIQLKLCLLYLALFPKDYDIPVRRLIRLWLAEGFVKRSQHELPEDLVQKYFEDLVDRSMIQITKLRSDNSPKKCRLVAVFHDYLLPKAKGISLFYIHRNLENFEDAGGPFGVRRMVQHIGITDTLATNTQATHSKVEMGYEENGSPSSSVCSPCLFWSGRKHRCTKIVTSHSNSLDLQNSQPQVSTFDPSLLRSYVSFNRQPKDTPAKEVDILLNSIVSSELSLLRVLDLEGVNTPTLPDNLGQLRLLRYLGLRRTYLKSLPESVGDLSYLETLDVKHTELDSLPDSIWKLEELRHLNLNNIRLAMPPSCSLTLLTLWGLVLDEKISVNEGLGKLSHLRELGIKFHLDKSQGVLLDWIARLVDLQSLRLTSADNGHASKLILKPLLNLEKLSNLNLLGNLEKLPAPNEFPPTLKVLTLSVSQLSKDPMETLEQLPHLIMLRLLRGSYTGKKMACRRGGFKKLKVLKLWMLEELDEWEVEEDAMKNLKELDIRCCHKLNNIPSRLLHKERCLDELILTGMPDDFVGGIKKTKSKDTSLTINSWCSLA